jgi:rubredoxin
MLREFAELFGYVTPPAAQPEQEPVVFYRCNGCGHAYEQVHPTSCDCMGAGGFDRVEYFTTPPAAQRKPLTDDQIDEIAVIARRGNLHDLRIAIEAKLKERNT